VVNSIDVWTVDAACNILSHDVDSDADGTVDVRDTSTYDAENNTLTEDTDAGNDGSIEFHRVFMYGCW
jgi:hypothetical protein